MGLQAYLTLAAVVFGIGLFGVATRRNTIGILLGIELMLNAVNINLVAFDVWLRDELLAGQVFTLFVITIAAAEVGLGLAIVLLVFRNRETTQLNELHELHDPAEEPVP
jgi:NADH-quinone oxidoreductase subunit K